MATGSKPGAWNWGDVKSALRHTAGAAVALAISGANEAMAAGMVDPVRVAKAAAIAVAVGLIRLGGRWFTDNTK